MKLRKEMVKVNDKVCKGRKCFIVSMLFMLTFFFSIGFMEQSSKADTVNYSEGDFSYQLTQETKTATLQKYTGISQSVTNLLGLIGMGQVIMLLLLDRMRFGITRQLRP